MKRLMLQRLKKKNGSEYMERSTNEAMEKMANEKIRCWNKTHTKMKWRLALRIATSPSERWLMKAAEWNSEFISKYRTNTAIGTNSSKLLKTRQKTLLKAAAKSTKHGSTQQKDRGRWTLLEENYTMTSEERHEKMREGEEVLITDQRCIATV